jgi:hypothetical protein
METRNCQNCKKDFNIEPDDFSFYEKMKVPAPTFCPDCRRERRLAYYNLTHLFYRNCDLCSERFISMYPKDALYTVYCPKCWWSDKWDWRDYSKEYDFSRTFFEQYNELFHTVPLLGLSINSTTTQGSPYNNHASDLKDCYLTFDSDFNQECAYGVLLTRNRDSFDSSMVMDTENCYDCMCIYKSNKVIGTRGNNRFCVDCTFVRDCENCQDCFMCENLKNKKYFFKNKQLTKEEYENAISSYDLGSYFGYQKAKKEAEEFWKTMSPRPVWDTLSVDYSGSYVFHSKNCHECYDVVDAEDCKYCMMLYRNPQKNCMDVSGFGLSIENIYDSINIGEYASDVKFSDESGHHLLSIDYSKLSFGSSYHFGCVSVRKGEYVIFNKTYPKDEYFALKEKIIAHMNENPFIDKNGNVYMYGEFPPIEMSPFPYNTTYANLFYPKTKEKIESLGYSYQEEEKIDHTVTMGVSILPDHISDATSEIMKETLGCQKCGKGFKIIQMEFDFLKKMNVPLPRECPFCRINEKLLLWVDNMTLKNRLCDKCGIDFRTHFGVDRAPIIYCKSCYTKEYI